MQYLIDAWDNFINMIQTAWEIVVHFFQSLGKLLDIIMHVVQLIYNLATAMPPWLEAFIVGTTIICIAMIIVGREKGRSA